MLQSNLHLGQSSGSSEPRRPANGTVTQRKQKRSLLVYLFFYASALLLVCLSRLPDLRQFGLGVMVPGGAGFAQLLSDPSIVSGLLAVGGVGVAGLGCLIWFATGSVFAPPIGWIGGAIWLALALPGGTPTSDLWIAVIPPVLIGAGLARQSRPQFIDKEHAHQLAAAQPGNGAGATETDDALSDADLARLRLLLDRALQPIQDFNGFEKLDQFQTAALRYQINFISYALSMVQSKYMPAFKGYMHEAQENLKTKQQDRRIWGYWKLENMWGNLRLSGDPIAKDNIMYSGFVAAQLMYWIKSTSYPNDAQDVILRCEANTNTVYQYTLPELIEQLTQQYQHAEFGLLPCEPNWIYPLCNAITGTAIRAYDTHFKTDHWGSISETFQNALETEFTNSKGQLVPFRSSYTGFAPMAVGGAVMQAFPCFFLNPILPEVAQRYWQLTQHFRGKKSWRAVIWPVDVGNYRLSRAAGYAATAVAAKEMSDHDAANELLAHLDRDIPSTTRNGITHRAEASLWAHANEVMARAADGSTLHRLVNAPPKARLPYIKTARYPDVLVAKAVGFDDGLSLVLVPGRGRTAAQIVIAGLTPNTRFCVDGLHDEPQLSTSDGEMTLTFDLSDRLALKITRLEKEC